LLVVGQRGVDEHDVERRRACGCQCGIQ
jgi:hypothetical protein